MAIKNTHTTRAPVQCVIVSCTVTSPFLFVICGSVTLMKGLTRQFTPPSEISLYSIKSRTHLAM